MAAGNISKDAVLPLICRDSWTPHYSQYDYFSKFSCVKCFVQVFFNTKELTMNFADKLRLYHRNNASLSYEPDADADPSRVCTDWLSDEECTRWRGCCASARLCCAQNQQQDVSSRSASDGRDSCPATWDGVSCWSGDTAAGVLAAKQCPQYYIADNVQWLSPHATRRCLDGGMWTVNPDSPNGSWEISNYDECFNTQTNINVLKASLYIDFVGNGLSIIFLLSAIILILASRPLRLELAKKNGLRLHFNLFVSVLLMGVFTVAFHSVYFDAFTAASSETAIPVYHNNAIWCRVLHALTKYFKSTAYMAMLCEGIFLYKRISNVMRMGFRDTMLKYLLITWVVPGVLVLSYVIVRVSLQRNDRCWIDHGLSFIEYIIIVPNILSLVCNLLFLISIEWMLCTKMRSDTSDRRVEVLRHALRATLSLIPIFGLQFLFIIYRPQHWPPYEIIIAVFTSTQGILVAILYCFATKEVKREINAIARKCTEQRRDSLTPSVSSTRSTRRSHLSSVSTFVSNIITKGADNIRHSLPDLISSARYADRRGSAASKSSRRSRARRDSGLSVGTSEATTTPTRSRATSETESLILHTPSGASTPGVGGGPGDGEGSPVWVRRMVAGAESPMDPVQLIVVPTLESVETSFTAEMAEAANSQTGATSHSSFPLPPIEE